MAVSLDWQHLIRDVHSWCRDAAGTILPSRNNVSISFFIHCTFDYHAWIISIVLSFLFICLSHFFLCLLLKSYSFQLSDTHAVFRCWKLFLTNLGLPQVSGDVRTGVVHRPPDLPVYQHTPPPSPSAWMGICLMFPSPLLLGSLASQTVSDTCRRSKHTVTVFVLFFFSAV